MPWLTRLTVAALAALTALPVPTAQAQQAPSRAPLLDVELTADATLVRGVPGVLALRTSHAWSLTRREGTAADVLVTLAPREGAQGAGQVLFEGRTGADGSLEVTLAPVTVADGRHQLELIARSEQAEHRTEWPVEVVTRTLLQLTTDRAVYRGGQTVRWRVAALGGVDARPLDGAAVEVRVTDPRGTRIWQGAASTDATGFVAGELPLADDLLLGTYRLEARLEDTRAQASVDVRAFELPPFTVEVSADATGGRVTARYPYGEPVRGAVRVIATVDGAPVPTPAGALDAHGRFEFALPGLKGRRGTLQVLASVTDGAERTRHGSATARLGGRGLNLAVLPEREPLRAGMKQRVTVVATDDEGALVAADVRLRVDGRVVARGAAPEGVLVAEIEPPAWARRLEPWAALHRVETRGTEWGERDFERLVEAIEARLPRVAECLVGSRTEPFDAWAQVTVTSARGRPRVLRVARQDPGLPDLAVDVEAAERTCVQKALGTLRLPGGARDGGRLELNLTVGATEADDDEGPPPQTLKATARAAGEVAEATLEVEVTPGPARGVRVGTPVVAAGAPIEVEAAWTATRRPLVVTLVREGAALATATAEVGADGRARARLRAPEGVFGLASVRVTEAGWDGDGVVVEDEQTAVYLAPAALDVRVEAATRHRPGDDAEVQVLVADAAGRPAAGVGLAAAVVDERVLSLGPPRQPLAEAVRFGGLEAATAAGLTFRDYLPEAGRAGARALLRGILDAVPGAAGDPVVMAPAEARRAQVARQVGGLAEALVEGLRASPGALVRLEGARWVPAVTVAEALARGGVEEERRRGPFGAALTWGDVEAAGGEITAAAAASGISWERLERLESEVERLAEAQGVDRAALVAGGLEAVSGLPEALRVDAWGGRVALVKARGEGLSLVAPGPDGRVGTGDDLVLPEVMTPGSGRGWLMAAHGVAGVGTLAGRNGSLAFNKVGSIARGAMMGALTAPLRERFDETVLWSVGTRTDGQGRATLQVPLADSVTGWEVAVEALSPRGAVGHAKGRLETFLPMAVDAALPERLTVGDRFTVQAVVANHSGAERRLTVEAAAAGAVRLDGGGLQSVVVPDGATAAVPVPLVAEAAGEASLTLRLSDEGGEVDAMRRPVVVDPPGRPELLVATGRVSAGAGGRLVLPFTLPATLSPESLDGRVRVFRDASDQALDGLEDLLREPTGCFEQTSTTTYPNLLVLRLLEGRRGRDAARARARELVAKGYQRLLRYEVKGGGFSWFGDAPANRVLTAYGLAQFSDMARVYPVDPAVIERTRQWLVGLQRPDGSWEPDPKWLHDWSAQQGTVATTAWIAWALAQAAPEDPALGKALAFLQRNAASVDGPYVAALWAAAARLAGRPSAAATRLVTAHLKTEGDARFVAMQAPTLLYGGGRAADVEVTALAATLGDALPAEAMLEWLWAARDPRGGWGTTQATVQSLRALAAHAEGAAPAEEGLVEVALDGRAPASLDLAGDGVPTLKLPGGLSPGEHALRVSTEVPGRLRVELRARWRGAEQAEAVESGLAVSLTTDSPQTQVGGQVPMRLRLTHPGSAVLAMPTAVVPVPPGFEVDARSLERLVAEGRLARFEDHGRELQLYMTQLGAGETVTLDYALEATAACDVTQHGARAFAYYDPSVHGYSANLRLRATARP